MITISVADGHTILFILIVFFFFYLCSSVTPEDWQSFSNENILKAERDRKNSADLRAVVDSLLDTTANDMQQQVDETNLAFSKRIRETDTTKGKLETHLAKVSKIVFCSIFMHSY